MKTRKKLIGALTITALLASAVFAFSGCSESASGTESDTSPLSSASANSAVSASSEASADANGGPRGPRLLDFAGELGLTDEQITQITALEETFKAELTAIRESFNGERPTEEQRAEHRALREEHRTEIMALLTEEQQTKLEELRAAHRAENPNGRGGKGGNGKPGGANRPSIDDRLTHLTEALGLSEEQVGLLRTAFETMQSAVKTEDGTRPDREIMIAAREALHTAVESILTPEQMTAFEELRQNRQGRQGQQGGRGNGQDGRRGPRGGGR